MDELLNLLDAAKNNLSALISELEHAVKEAADKLDDREEIANRLQDALGMVNLVDGRIGEITRDVEQIA